MLPRGAAALGLGVLLATGVVLGAAAQETLGPASVKRIPSPLAIEHASAGETVAGLGDLNADGVADFAVGAPGIDRVFVYSGATRGIIRVLFDPHPWLMHQFGFSVDAVGDIDHDGVEDIGVGAPNLDAASPAPCVVDPLSPGSDCLMTSQAYLMSGATGALITRLAPPRTAQTFGFRVAGIGDVDADGTPDVAVSDPAFGDASAGVIAALSGSTGLELWSTRGQDASLVNFGASLTSAGDANRDGRRDVLASAVDARDPAHETLTVWLLSGVDGSSIRMHVVSDASTGAAPLAGLADAGDQDNDRVSDYATGNPRARQVTIWSGATGRVVSRFDGPLFGSAGDGFGWAIANVGDKDNDSADDLWIGAPGGGLVLLCNRFGTVLAAAVDPTPPPAEGGQMPGFGHALAAIDSIGGDAGADLIVGEPGETTTLSNDGRTAARVLHDVGAVHVVTLPLRRE